MLPALTLVVTALVVLALVGWLTPTYWALRRARQHVHAIADGLELVRDRTRPLGEGIRGVNADLGAVAAELGRAEGHLADLAQAYGRD